jgi:hypothetical protein
MESMACRRIDGDGYLAIQTSNNVAVCEITMPLADEALAF